MLPPLMSVGMPCLSGHTGVVSRGLGSSTSVVMAYELSCLLTCVYRMDLILCQQLCVH